MSVADLAPLLPALKAALLAIGAADGDASVLAAVNRVSILLNNADCDWADLAAAVRQGTNGAMLSERQGAPPSRAPEIGRQLSFLVDRYRHNLEPATLRRIEMLWKGWREGHDISTRQRIFIWNTLARVSGDEVMP